MKYLLLGPLTYTTGLSTYAVGVVSWGMECGDPGKIGVYARVTSAMQWIHKNMNKTYKC